MKNGHMIFPIRLGTMIAQAVAWRMWVYEGPLSTTPRPAGILDCHVSHMRFNSQVEPWELDAICDASNAIFKKAKSPLRVAHAMGALRPGHKREPG